MEQFSIKRYRRYARHHENRAPVGRLIGGVQPPLLENTPAEGKKRRKYPNTMKNPDLIEYTKTIAAEQGIRDRLALKKAEPKLFTILMMRCVRHPDVMGLTGLALNDGQFDVMTQRELVQHAKGLIDKNGIIDMPAFQSADRKLYLALNKAGLMDPIIKHLRDKALRMRSLIPAPMLQAPETADETV